MGGRGRSRQSRGLAHTRERTAGAVHAATGGGRAGSRRRRDAAARRNVIMPPRGGARRAALTPDRSDAMTRRNCPTNDERRTANAETGSTARRAKRAARRARHY
ncbi:hypothetical protein SY87_01680 [Burkholderia pseudomallei]|nr:hypothetical protein SY87_01680 [Burkholderia pseudomallei]